MSISIPDNTLILLSDKPSEELLEIRSAYSQKLKIGLDCPTDEDRTDQSQAPECDINRIMARYMDTGIDLYADRLQSGQYGDTTGIDYAAAQEQIAQANSMFFDMPAQLRAEFDNSPQKFLEQMENPDNIAKMVRLGLATLPQDEKTTEPVPTPTPPAKTAPEGSKEPAPKTE